MTRIGKFLFDKRSSHMERKCDQATKLGMTQDELSDLESGRYLVSVSFVDKVCEVYALGADEREDLIEAVGEMVTEARNESDEECNSGDKIVYRLEVNKLEYDTEHNAFYDEIAFCTGYATYEDAREAVDYIDDLLVLSLDGWNPFTTAAVVKVNLDKGVRSEPLGEWVLCGKNVERLGKSLGDIQLEEDREKEEEG